MKSVKLFFVLIVLVVVVSSCSVEKRHYMKGYNVSWHKSKCSSSKNIYSDDKISFVKETSTETEIVSVEHIKETVNPQSKPIGSVALEKVKTGSFESSKKSDISHSYKKENFKVVRRVIKTATSIQKTKPYMGDTFLKALIRSAITSFVITIVIIIVFALFI